MTQPLHYYMLTNRTYDASNQTFGTTVAAGGALTYLMATVAPPQTFAVTTPDAWFEALVKDLELCSQGAAANATLFVHGYAVTFEDATTIFPTYFGNIESAQPPRYPGVFIGFDWPSDRIGINQPEAFQAAKQKAQQTGQLSFPLLLRVLEKISLFPKLALSCICHSMGNYAMFEGASAFDRKQGAKPLFEQMLCVAAMLESNGFNSPESVTYCANISAAAKRVTIYYSSHDDVLPTAEGKKYDDYQELGIWGPTYDATLLPNVFGLDCSNVVTEANARIWEKGVSNPLSHTAYFYIPEVLLDLALTSRGRPAGDMPNRTPIADTSVGFTLVSQEANAEVKPEHPAHDRRGT